MLSRDTCAAMSTVIPVLLLPLVLNIRDIGPAYRRGAVQQLAALLGTSSGVGGVIVALIGTQMDGLKGLPGIIAWTSFGIELAALVVILILVAATQRDSLFGEDDRRRHPVGTLLRWRFPWDRRMERVGSAAELNDAASPPSADGSPYIPESAVNTFQVRAARAPSNLGSPGTAPDAADLHER